TISHGPTTAADAACAPAWPSPGICAYTCASSSGTVIGPTAQAIAQFGQRTGIPAAHGIGKAVVQPHHPALHAVHMAFGYHRALVQLHEQPRLQESFLVFRQAAAVADYPPHGIHAQHIGPADIDGD